MGVVTCWNITEQLRVLGVGPLPPERNVSAHGNYDPHRRVHRDVLKSNLVPPVSSPYARRRAPHVVKKEFQWKAHTESISCLRHVEIPSCIITASQDGTSRVWSDTGMLLGQLDTSQEERNAVRRGRAEPIPWKFEVDEASFENSHKKRADKVLSAVGKLQRKQSEGKVCIRGNWRCMTAAYCVESCVADCAETKGGRV